MITFGSGCSGIEAASVAWEPIGFKPVWFSQFDPEHDYSKGPDYPSAVLQHHWPHIPNLGDLTTVRHQIELGYDAPDVFVAGTPCQAYSVAGKREGLADARGILTLEYVKIMDTIDEQRQEQQKPACIGVWENVPGVLSSADNAFGCLLGGLAGSDSELEPGPRPAAGKGSRIWRWCEKTRRHLPRWTNAGCVFGPKRTVAWRVLDAQYFGVAQRRRRVFVVASAREGFDPAAVLFECEGLRRDFAPSREAGKNSSSTAGASFAVGSHWDGDGYAHPALSQSHNTGGIGASNQELFSQRGTGLVPAGSGAYDNQGQAGHLIAVHGTQDPDTNSELAHTLGRNHGQENAIAYSVALRGREGGATAELGDEVAGCLRASSGGGDKPHVLAQCATGRGQPIVPVAFSSKDYGGDATENMSPTLRACGHADSHANAGAPPAVAYPILEVGKRTGTSTTDPRAGLGIGSDGDPMFTLQAGAQHGVAAFAENSRQEVRFEGGDGQITGALSSGGGKVGQGYPAAMVGMAVRRLTPVECERLQGFPDGHTDVPYRGKPAADGHRYKALGNSKAVPVVAWLGKRIKKQIEYSEFDSL